MKDDVQSTVQSSFGYNDWTEAGMSRRVNRDELALGIRRGEFVPFYQPKFDLQTGQATGVEILGRWMHPERGLLLPDHFIEYMERYGLIDQLTECLFAQSLAFARESAKIGNDIGFAINVSPLSLRNPRLGTRIRSIMRESGMRADRITIEVTESASSDRSHSVATSLTYLREEGFQISVDDFGTGYSSLKLLSRVPFTELKIDRSFVTDARWRPKSALIMESIMHLARKLRLQTVAEGIETGDDARFARSLGCDTGQGYLLAKPMSESELTNYLATQSYASAA